MAGAYVDIAAMAVEKARLGYSGVSLTHFSDSLEPAIAAGSKLESGSALYDFSTDETITGLAGIANGSQVYIKTTVSGTAITASATITAPTWSTSKQAWYTGSDRVIGGLYRDSGGNYTGKWLYPSGQQGPGWSPVGAILAWHKSLAGCPPLPANWVECNGQVLSDSGSPFNGQTIPNLNGLGHFLRGSAVSGTVQSDSTKMPNSPFNLPMATGAGGSRWTQGGSGTFNQNIQGGDSETRPVNMSVVWIMRVK